MSKTSGKKLDPNGIGLKDRQNISPWARVLAGFMRMGRPAQLRYNWQFVPAYWSLRKRLLQLSFYFLRGRYAFRIKLGSARQSAQIFILILRSVGRPLLSAAFIVGVSGAIDYGFQHIIQKTAGSAERGWMMGILFRSFAALRFNEGAASTLFGTLAQIAGVFLGLYFAVVGTLVSTRYANVPPKVRELLIADKLGNQYIQLVALFGAVATLLLAAQSIGIFVGLVNIAVVAFLGVATILSFIILGRRAFEFFDPGTLIHQLSSELVGWINRATMPRHFGWQSSFQAHYQRQAAGLLESYEGIVKLTASDGVSQQHTLPHLARQTLALMSYYGRRKSRLAGDSMWFRRQYEHKNWLTTSYEETSMALRTGTTLRPKEVPDLYWFEMATGEIFWFAYKQLLDAGKLGEAAKVSLSATEALEHMGDHLLLVEATRFSGAWAPLFRGEALKTKLQEPASEPEQRQMLQRLVILESYALGVIRLFLSFAARVSGEGGKRLLESVAEKDWLNRDRIYDLNLPRSLVGSGAKLPSVG